MDIKNNKLLIHAQMQILIGMIDNYADKNIKEKQHTDINITCVKLIGKKH